MASLKYKTHKQVMLALLNGQTRRHFQELKTRHKRKGNLEYAELIQRGIDRYDEFVVDGELRTYIDPDGVMSQWEWDETVGHRG